MTGNNHIIELDELALPIKVKL